MLPNDMFLNFDFSIIEKIKNIMQKSCIYTGSKILMKNKKLNLDLDDSDSDNENIIQDYDE